MTFVPWLGTMPQVDQDIQLGLNDVGSEVGQPFSVYRLSDDTNVGVLSGDPIYTNFPANIRRYTLKAAIENTTFELLAYVMNGNRLPLELQDLLVTEGYGSDGGVFCVAQMRPMAETILMAVPFNCTISAISPTAGAASQQPSSGTIAQTSDVGWSGVWKTNEKILTLVDGEYAFVPASEDPTPAQVQIGLQPNARIRDGNALGVPTEQYRAPFVIYCPNLPGIFLEEVKVRFNVGTGVSDRYEVTKAFSSNDAGLTGIICMVEKLPF